MTGVAGADVSGVTAKLLRVLKAFAEIGLAPRIDAAFVLWVGAAARTLFLEAVACPDEDELGERLVALGPLVGPVVDVDIASNCTRARQTHLVVCSM